MQSSGDKFDPLFDFELKVARRADELARDAQGRDPLELWCEAERQTGNPFTERVDSPEFRFRKHRGPCG